MVTKTSLTSLTFLLQPGIKGLRPKPGNLRKFSFTSKFDSGCNARFKRNKKWTESKTKKFKKKNDYFRGFRVFDFALYKNRKLGNLGNMSLTSNFDSSYSQGSFVSEMKWAPLSAYFGILMTQFLS